MQVQTWLDLFCSFFGSEWKPETSSCCITTLLEINNLKKSRCIHGLELIQKKETQKLCSNIEIESHIQMFGCLAGCSVTSLKYGLQPQYSKASKQMFKIKLADLPLAYSCWCYNIINGGAIPLFKFEMLEHSKNRLEHVP